MAKILWIFLLVFFFTSTLFAQVNEFLLDPVDLEISTGDSTIQVNININTVDSIICFLVPVFAEGTCNPVLDTVLTGGLGDSDPPCFAEPSLVSTFWTKYVNPYGPPSDPMIFMAKNFATSLPPSSGLFCRMFYKVSGLGTLTFRTAVHSTAGGVGMFRMDATSAPINWPAEGEVGSFEVYRGVIYGDASGDGEISVTDIIYLLHYMFYNGPPPNPFLAGDANCDGSLTISDVVYLINFLFKGGPAPGC